MAVSKALAQAARAVTRGLHRRPRTRPGLSAGAIVWAAIGKDEGFCPLLLPAMMKRHARIEPGTLDQINARVLDPIARKIGWIRIFDKAEISHLADTQLGMPIGVAFVDQNGEPGWIGANPNLKIQHGSLRDCWPTFSEVECLQGACHPGLILP